MLAIAAAPVAAAVGSGLADWDATATGLVAILPLVALIMLVVLSIERTHGAWLAFFGVITLPQVGHFGEHVGQMVQIHALGTAPPAAHGAVGALDIEWVHFLWNGGVLMGVAMLTMRYRRNRWLWATAAIGAWHMAEHLTIMLTFWGTGKAGDPGLLARGGDIGGGLSLIRPDLHFLYNLAMTLPLAIAFLYQLRRSARADAAPGAAG